MYLKKQKRANGRIYLSIVEGFRESGKIRTRHIKSLGYLDELEQKYDDPIAHFEAEVAQLNAQRKGDQGREASETIGIAYGGRIRSGSTTSIHLGAAIPRTYYYHELGIGRFFDRLRFDNRSGCNPQKVLELLVWHRISQFSSSRMSFAECCTTFPLNRDITVNQVAYTLQFIIEHQSELVEWVSQSLRRVRVSAVPTSPYYTLSRYFFRHGKDDKADDGPEANPLVHLGVLNDIDGIPIDYELAFGASDDPLFAEETLARLHAKCPTGHLTLLANASTKTGAAIRRCLEQGDDFVLLQPVPSLADNAYDWVLDDNAYQSYDNNTLFIKEFEQAYRLPDLIAKGSDVLNIRHIAFWSNDIESRYYALRAKWLQRSLSLMSSGEGAPFSHTGDNEGPSRQTRQTINVLDSLDYAAVDWAKLEQSWPSSGYRFLITNNLTIDSRRIVSDFQGLDRIYNLFDVYKTDIYFDKSFASIDRMTRIRAHVLVSYIAVVIMRLMQIDTDWVYSQTQIADALCNIVGHRVDANHYLFDYRSSVSDALSRGADIDVSKRILTAKDVRSIMSTARNPLPRARIARQKKKRSHQSVEQVIHYGV